MKEHNNYIPKEHYKEEREKRVYKRVFALVSSGVFIIALLIFGFVSFVDTDATVSEKENRKLATKPEFSFSALFDGSYIKDFENYYSDTFPLRNGFINLNQKISSILTQFGGKDDNVIISIQKHDDDIGESGNLSTSAPTTDKNGNTQTTKKEHTTAAKDVSGAIKGSVLVSGTRAMELFSYSQSTSEKYASLINKVAKSMPSGVTVYSMLAPTSVEFYGGKTYSTGAHSQYKAIQVAYAKMNSSIKTIDAYSYLEDSTKEYIYFRTDHHWTARGAYCGYKAFCKASGNTPVDIKKLETGKIGDFVGSLYKASNASVLKENPDYVEYFKTRVDVDGQVFQSSELKNGFKFFIVARSVNSSNKYLSFIAGDQPLERIITSNKNGKKILVVKESYGNALVPFLCDNYEEVYVVDPRQINFDLPAFMAKQEIQNILLVNYTFAMSNSTFCNALDKMIK